MVFAGLMLFGWADVWRMLLRKWSARTKFCNRTCYVGRGLRVPTIDRLFRLARAMGLNPVSLLAKAAAPELGSRSSYRRRTREQE
jgi:hypothetical protein